MKIDQKIQDMIRNKNTQLPTLPVVVEKILSMARQDNSSAKDLAELISRDQAISNKILRLSNSAYYGMMKEIDSVPRAITIIGFNEVISLTIGMSVISAFSRGNGEPVKNFNMKGLWIHSLGCAFAAKKTAKKLGIMQAEQIFISGLLHDMGKVIFAIYFPGDYTATYEYTKENEIDLFKGEKLMLGIDHAVLSGLLMERWNFPDSILIPARYHHSVDQCPPRYQQISQIIAFSDYLSQKAEFGDSWTVKTPGIMKIRDQLGLDLNEADDMAEDLKKDKEEIEAFFEVMK
ncbi:MAG: HDOD domain-containing protein [Deltaproteobacteria bacterium]|nr:HDOD domain-containing protein [Deltaproteobacteria bacterium]